MGHAGVVHGRLGDGGPNLVPSAEFTLSAAEGLRAGLAGEWVHVVDGRPIVVGGAGFADQHREQPGALRVAGLVPEVPDVLQSPVGAVLSRFRLG